MRNPTSVFGFVDFPDEKRFMSDFMEEYTHAHKGYNLEQCGQSNVWLGFLDNHNMCKRADIGGNIVVLLGEIYDNGEGHLIKDDGLSILESYDLYGTESFGRLNGSFAFALFDSSRDTVFLVRDKMGTVPIYYYFDSKGLIFSSSIRMIFHSSIKREINEKYIYEYLAFRYLAGENTLFKGVLEIQPGEYIVCNRQGEIKRSRYYKCDMTIADGEHDDETITRELDTALTESINTRLHKNHEATILLSGGLDSGYVAHKLRQKYSGSIHSYTVGYHYLNYDESERARWIKNRYDFHHCNHYVCEDEYFKAFIDALYIHEEPFNHPHSVSMSIISHLASQEGKKVFFTGEGADSILGTSPNILLLRLSRMNKHVKDCLRYLFQNIPTVLLPEIVRKKHSKILNALAMNDDELSIVGSAYGDTSWLESSANWSIPSARYEILRGHSSVDLANRYLGFVQETSLISSLTMFSKMTSAYGIRFIAPFMDDRVVSYMNSLPSSYKFKGSTGKYIFKKLCERIFPREFVYSSKFGFGAPLEHWLLNKPMMGRYLTLLLDQRSLERGYVDKKALESLIEKYINKQLPDYTYEGLLWTLMNLEIWTRLMIEETNLE